MDTRAARELREQIAHCRCLRRMTVDARTLEAIDKSIAEAEEHLRQLEPAQVDR